MTMDTNEMMAAHDLAASELAIYEVLRRIVLDDETRFLQTREDREGAAAAVERVVTQLVHWEATARQEMLALRRELACGSAIRGRR